MSCASKYQEMLLVMFYDSQIMNMTSITATKKTRLIQPFSAQKSSVTSPQAADKVENTLGSTVLNDTRSWKHKLQRKLFQKWSFRRHFLRVSKFFLRRAFYCLCVLYQQLYCHLQYLNYYFVISWTLKVISRRSTIIVHKFDTISNLIQFNQKKWKTSFHYFHHKYHTSDPFQTSFHYLSIQGVSSEQMPCFKRLEFQKNPLPRNFCTSKQLESTL